MRKGYAALCFSAVNAHEPLSPDSAANPCLTPSRRADIHDPALLLFSAVQLSRMSRACEYCRFRYRQLCRTGEDGRDAMHAQDLLTATRGPGGGRDEGPSTQATARASKRS